MNRVRIVCMALPVLLFAEFLPSRLDASDVVWLSPSNGLFQDPANWQGGNMPVTSDTVIFGLNSGANEFDVTFTGSATSANIFVTNQRPVLQLQGFSFGVSNELLVAGGGTYTAHLGIQNGTVNAPSGSVSIGANTGNGILQITNGGHLNCGYFGTGTGNPPSTGTVLVSGAASSLQKSSSNFGDVNFGHGAGNRGELHVSGATVSFANGNVFVGREGGSGLIELTEGAEMTMSGGTLFVNSANNGPTSGGLFVRGPLSRITMPADDLWVYGQARLFDSLISSRQVFVAPFGSLYGNSTITLTSQVFMQCPGNLSPQSEFGPTGVMSINGPYAQWVYTLPLPNTITGTLNIDIAGPTVGSQYDRLAVSGIASLAGTLNVALVGGYIPPLGQSFQVMTYGQRIGTFDDINLPVAPPGIAYVPTYGPNAVSVFYDQVTSLSLSPDENALYVGFSTQLLASAQLGVVGATDVTLTALWSSDDPEIATVASNGLVTPQSPGSTTIRVSIAGLEAQAQVDVAALPSQLATDRMSVDSNEVQGNGLSDRVTISSDGRFIAFNSTATNLVPSDTNGVPDIFVRDRIEGTTYRASIGTGGIQSNAYSDWAALSADGRYVVFHSGASNLVPNDATINREDVFVHDRLTGETELVSLNSAGVQANHHSNFAAVSGDGRFVAFYSIATNLVTNDTNGVGDVFVRDRLTGTTTRVSIGTGGVQGNAGAVVIQVALSADGRHVLFGSDASNLVPGDTNGTTDLFVYDQLTGQTERVSIGDGGVQANGQSSIYQRAISADGRFVAFHSLSTNLVPGDTNGVRDAFLRDRLTGTTVRINLGPGGVQGNSAVGSITISDDGRFASFRSAADNLVANDTNGVDDIFVYNRITGTLSRESVSFIGSQSNNLSQLAGLSADGRVLSFYSTATNLAPFDTNAMGDVFARVRAFEGDLNCDGEMSVLDIPAFVQALMDPVGYSIAFQECFPSGADLDMNGSADGHDVQAFVTAILTP